MRQIVFLICYYLVQNTASYQVTTALADPSVKKLLEYVKSPRFRELSSDGQSTLFSEVLQNIVSRPSRQSLAVGEGKIHGEQNNTNPRNCMDIMTSGKNDSGVYTIQPNLSEEPFKVLCDMKTQGGGWTYIQKRDKGRVDFERSWSDYKFGFGNLSENSEHWIGLENIYALTGQRGSELLIEITDRDGLTAYALYKNFAVGREQEAYPLAVISGYSGDAGDSLSAHLGVPFSTFDFDHTKNQCAGQYKSGWWYTECFSANLNGKFTNVDLSVFNMYKGIHWTAFKNLKYCHAKARMLVRPVQI